VTGTRVVVLGCGVAGMLAAAAVAEHTDTVTILERDRMPPGPAVRKGVPQGRHLHGLSGSGAQAIEALLPGFLAGLRAGGAHRLGLPERALVYGPHGWMCRYPSPHFLIGASRALVEWAIRTRLLCRYPVEVLEGVEVLGLLGDADRVRGVRVRHRDTGRSERVAADLVIDATGRGAKTPRWLTELGLPPVVSTVVDSGLVYASRAVRVSASAQSYPFIAVQADPRDNTPGMGGLWLGIENNQTMITLSGTRGARPPLEEEGFTRFAHSLRHPLLGELLADATPLTRISGFRDTANRRHHYHRLPSWPAGLLVIGDAVAAFNPIYGQGMTVAALSALTLRDALRGSRLDGGGCHRIQRALSRTADLSWMVCTSEDIRYPGAQGPSPGTGTRLVQCCADRLRATAAGHPGASRAFFDVFSLSVPLTRLARPAAIWATLRGPRRPPLLDPPLGSQSPLDTQIG
jgi:2-polyprenyl-6-methoxyphenol hydroxylase-like FAD-dependent oxidoreductase